MVSRKFLACCLLAWALVFAGFAAPAGAQMASDIPPEMIRALEAEKPLSQADVDLFIKIMPQFAQAGQADSDAVLKVLSEAGLTETRMSYIFGKISLGLMMNNDPALASALEAEEVPKALWPTADDLKLIGRNREALLKLFQAHGSADGSSE